MAITTSKVTYSLKPETVLRIEELAVEWNVPKSEVVRRMVAEAGKQNAEKKKPRGPLEAFRWLQKNGISRRTAAKFNAEVRAERKASGLKRR